MCNGELRTPYCNFTIGNDITHHGYMAMALYIRVFCIVRQLNNTNHKLACT